jgi:hypothetical protein
MQLIHMATNIGFFGDSFCSDRIHPTEYQTYIEQLSRSFDLEVTNLGLGGSSIYDTVLLQFQQQLAKGLPDICVFVWTSMDRLYHPTQRDITPRSIQRISQTQNNPEVFNAATLYYTHLYDQTKHELEYAALLHYFDKNTLSKLTDKKIIHLWSFNNYLYRWENGVEIKPALINLSIPNPTARLPMPDLRPNHLDQHGHDTVAEWVTAAINEYKSGELHNYTDK